MNIESAKKIYSPHKWSNITIVGILIYVVFDLVLTFLRPDYNWLHNAESDYGRGQYFWLMDINFILRCLVSLALVKALMIKFPKNRPILRASIWLAVWGLASGLLAFFADNPYGYPKLQSGSVHIFIAFIAFIAALIAMILFSSLHEILGLSRLTFLAIILLLGISIISLLLLGSSGFGPHRLGGLYERIFLGSVLSWQLLLAMTIKRDQKPATETVY